MQATSAHDFVWADLSKKSHKNAANKPLKPNFYAQLKSITSILPIEQHLAIPKKSRYVLPEYPPVKLYYWEKAAHDLGVMDFPLPEGILRVYDREKTVCDMFRLRSKAGLDIVKEVLKHYLQRPDRDLAKLHHYARQLRVERALNEFLMILI